MPGKEDGHPKDAVCSSALLALRAAGMTRTGENVGCGDCPFPFCVELEARRVQEVARAYLIQGMKQLNYTADVIADRLGISKPTVYKSTIYVSGCHWCNVDGAPERVFCRTNVCTVAFDEEQVAVVLARHRPATKQETSLTLSLVETLFPNAVMREGNGSTHEHWSLSNIAKDEANEVFQNMEYLSTFAPRLR